MTTAPTRPLRSRRASCLAAAGAVTSIVAGATFGSMGPAAAAGDDPSSAGAPSAQQKAAATGWVRAGQLLDGVVRADVRLTPAEGGSAVTMRNISYGDLTAYRNVPVGIYTVSLLPAGATSANAAMISTTVRVTDGSAATVVATGPQDALRASVLRDDLSAPPAGQAKVRLISGVTGNTVDAQLVNGSQLADHLSAGSSTDYADVAAQTWTIRLTSDGEVSTNTLVPVRAGGTYTLMALGTPDNLRLDAFRDVAGSTSKTTPSKTTKTKTTPAQGAPAEGAPTGGVDTGGGGLALRDAGQDAHAVGALGGTGIGFAAVFGAVLVAVRRRGAAHR